MPKGQFTSSLDKENVNEFINFLLSVTRKNQKIIHSSVNDILYNYVISRCTQLNCSISEYIKRLIIKDMLENGNIPIPIQNILTTSKNVSKESNHRNNKKQLLAKVRENNKKEKLEEIRKEYREIKKSFNRISRKLSSKYKDFSTLREASTIYERTSILLKVLEDFIKKHDISDDEYNELDKIIDDISDIRDTLRSYYKF